MGPVRTSLSLPVNIAYKSFLSQEYRIVFKAPTFLLSSLQRFPKLLTRENLIGGNQMSARGSHQKLTAVDLFAGCGGLTQGLRKAGFQVLGAVENDEKAAATYKLNHPGSHLWLEDIRNVRTLAVSRKLRLHKGDLDLLAGCPPCQGFSAMRTLNGNRRIRDKRNDLIFEFLRFVEDLRPKMIMMENVPGLATNRRFKLFRKRLAELGYCGEFKILNAACFGVPQRRRRLIYLAGLRTKLSFAEPGANATTVRDAISSLPVAGRSGDPVHDLPEQRSRAIRELIKRIPKDGGGRADLPRSRQLECHKLCDGFKDVYGRMEWDKVAPTITSGFFNPSKGRFLHPARNRAITVREASLLQGFPQSYKFNAGYGKVALAMMIGNALPPPFIAAHARQMKNDLAIARKQRRQ
jgi:DNA (cytosine-5)-methyltransferase 1